MAGKTDRVRAKKQVAAVEPPGRDPDEDLPVTEDDRRRAQELVRKNRWDHLREKR